MNFEWELKIEECGFTVSDVGSDFIRSMSEFRVAVFFIVAEFFIQKFSLVFCLEASVGVFYSFIYWSDYFCKN